MTEEYVPPSLRMVEPEELAEQETEHDITVPMPPTPSDILQDKNKELPAAFMRYMNGLMRLTTGAERTVQQLSHLVSTKIIDTRMSALHHGTAEDARVRGFGTDIVRTAGNVLSGTIAYALDRSENNEQELKARQDELLAAAVKPRDVFPPDSYAYNLWEPWILTVKQLVTLTQQFVYGFVQAGRIAQIEDDDIRMIMGSLNDGWADWSKQVDKLNAIDGGKDAMRLAALAEEHYRKCIAAGTPNEQAIASTIAELNRESQTLSPEDYKVEDLGPVKEGE